jgi:hypothetical protein
MLQADAPLESRSASKVLNSRLPRCCRLPALVAGDAQDAVAHVVVHPEDVGVLVVLKLWVNRQCLDEPLMSHSHVEE